MKNLFDLCLLAILVTLASCRSTRDSKALGRVLANPDLREQVYNIQSGLHPIAPQQPVYIKGKDSIIEVSVPVYYDSVIQSQCPTLNIDSLKKAWTKTVLKIRVDTITQKDTTLVRIIDNLNEDNYFKLGQLIEKDKHLEVVQKQSDKRLRWMIGEGVVALLIIGFLAYLLFKK